MCGDGRGMLALPIVLCRLSPLSAAIPFRATEDVLSLELDPLAGCVLEVKAWPDSRGVLSPVRVGASLHIHSKAAS